MTSTNGPVSQWDRYMALSAEMDGRLPGLGDAEADHFHDACGYAESVETAETTDEEWATAFWAGYHAIADDAAGGARAGRDPEEPANGGECPGCGRVMSNREADEQGICNDCQGGAW